MTTQAEASKTSSTEEWTVVTRRRRPPHFLPSPHSPPTKTTTINATPPTYAQALKTTPKTHYNASMSTNTKVPDPANHSAYARSPHSPTMLRYPPNPHFKEWWGRCFRCAKKGHIVADCTAPRLPSKQTTLVHTAANTMHTGMVQHTLTTGQSTTSAKRPRAEPSFEEFLTDPEPNEQPPMPLDRPKQVTCYINRDDSYFQTLEKTLRSIVIDPPAELVAKLSLDQVAEIIAASTKVSPPQLQVAPISKDRFLVLLPQMLDRETVVKAIPRHVWDEGYKFFSYSPLMDTSVSIPFFKLWIDLVGVPIELQTEIHMARAVSSFGLYLGFVEPKIHGDRHTWSIFLATDDLAQIPLELHLKIGGMVYTVDVCPRKWIRGQVYQHSDLPPVPTQYHPNPSPPPMDASFSDPLWFQEDDVIPMSLTALREIFRNFNPTDLPRDLVACLAGNTDAIQANHAAARRWEVADVERRMARPSGSQNPAQHPATQHPNQAVLTAV